MKAILIKKPVKRKHFDCSLKSVRHFMNCKNDDRVYDYFQNDK